MSKKERFLCVLLKACPFASFPDHWEIFESLDLVKKSIGKYPNDLEMTRPKLQNIGNSIQTMDQCTLHSKTVNYLQKILLSFVKINFLFAEKNIHGSRGRFTLKHCKSSE